MSREKLKDTYLICSTLVPSILVLCHVGCGDLLPALVRADAGLIQIIYDLTVPARNRRLALFPARGVPGVPSSAFPSYISSGSSASNVSSNLERRRGGRNILIRCSFSLPISG